MERKERPGRHGVRGARALLTMLGGPLGGVRGTTPRLLGASPHLEEKEERENWINTYKRKKEGKQTERPGVRGPLAGVRVATPRLPGASPHLEQEIEIYRYKRKRKMEKGRMIERKERPGVRGDH